MVLLTGCGFQLRGTDLAALGDLNLSGVYGETRKAYVEHFAARGLNITSTLTDGITVRFEDQRSQRRPVATSATIDAAQYELRLEVDFSVHRGSETLVPLSTIWAERIYSVDSFNLAGSYEEQMMLIDDIRAELTRQILQRIESAQLDTGA
jgi:outer membrane lipopolysaccharide assembly protein LptE/RlpB